MFWDIAELINDKVISMDDLEVVYEFPTARFKDIIKANKYKIIADWMELNQILVVE